MIGFEPGKGVELLENLLQRRGGGVGSDRGRDAPDALAAVEVEGRAGPVGVAVLLAQILVQAAEEIFAEQVIADQSCHVAWIAPVDPVPAHADHALHRTRFIDQEDRRPALASSSRPGLGLGPELSSSPAAESLFQDRSDRVGIDVARDDERGPLGSETASVEGPNIVECQPLDRLGITLGRLAVRVIGSEHDDRQSAAGEPGNVVRPLEQARQAAGFARGRSPWGRTGETSASRPAESSVGSRFRASTRAPTPMSSWPAATRTAAPSSSKASASSVAVFVAVPWSSSRAVRCARPDFALGIVARAHLGQCNEIWTSGSVFQVAIQRSMPLESVRRMYARRLERRCGVAGPGKLGPVGPCRRADAC